MANYIGWKLIVTPEESEKVQKHAFHFGYKWSPRSDYCVDFTECPCIFFEEDRGITCLLGTEYFVDYTNYKTITVKDFLKLTL